MRPAVLNSGYPARTKMLFAVIERVARSPLPDAAKVMFYRPDFYGGRMKRITHEAMRGDSAWSVGERELMAAYVSSVNRSSFCIGAHSATASQALADDALVAAVLADLETAPIGSGLRATLRLLGTLTRDHTVTAADVRAVLDAGVSPEQIEDALAVGFAFNVINRVADACDFAQLPPEDYRKGARYLLKRGYR